MRSLNTNPEYFDRTVKDYDGCSLSIRPQLGGPSGIMTSYSISRRGQLVAMGDSDLAPGDFHRELKNAVERARGESSLIIKMPQRVHSMRRVG